MIFMENVDEGAKSQEDGSLKYEISISIKIEFLHAAKFSAKFSRAGNF